MSREQRTDGGSKATDGDSEHRPVRRCVLVADDHPQFRLSLREEIEEAGLEVCAEAGSADEAVRLALDRRPDLCLLDLNMYGSGIEAARVILESAPETRIVVFTASSDFEDFVLAVAAGIHGYVTKDLEPGRLSEVVRDVLAGNTVYPHRFAVRLIGPSGVHLE
jgi:DNA-binding NarL/FixJ family response regulator